MDSPFSLTTASTSTLIIHIPDPNSTDEKEIRISAEPDPTAHNPESNDTPTNPTRNHLNLSIAPPPPPSSLPVPAASVRKGPPLQIATAPHTSQSAKMSGRGFVEPHHSHLPRRTRMRVVSRSRSRRRSRSSSSSSWARSSRSRTRMQVDKVDEAQDSPQPQASTQDENPDQPTPQEANADDGDGDGDDAETDFDSNKTEDGFLHETDSVRANTQKELLSALERGKMRPSYAYTLERLLGPSFNAPRTPQLESNPLLASMTIPEPQATPGAGPLTKDSTTSQHLQPHVGNLPRRRKTIQASHKREYIDRRTARSVSQGVSTLRRSLSNDDYNDDEGLGGREEEVRGRDRRGFSLERIGSLREDGGEDGLANGYGHPHPRLDSSRPPRSVPPGYRSTSVSVSKRVDQREPLRERMKLQEVGRGVWIGVCDEDIRLRCREGNTEEEESGDGIAEERRGRKGWEGGTISQNATTNIWEDVEREIDTLSHSAHPTKKRRIRGILTIDETDSLSSSPTASSPSASSSKPPPRPPNDSLLNLCLTVPSLSALASKHKGEPIEIGRGCTRLSVEQMKEGCKFMGVVLSSRSVSGDVREREGRGGEDSEEPITLLLASNEECMVDVMSMALCYLVVQEIGGGAGGCSGLGREGGEDGESEVVEERVVGEEERMVEARPAPPGESAPGSDALDPPTTTARLNLDTTSPSVLSPCATVRPSVGLEESSPRVEGEVMALAEGGDEGGLTDGLKDGEVKNGAERRVEGPGGPEVGQEGARDEADISRDVEAPLRPVNNLEGNTASADDSTPPTAVDESATSTTTEDHSTTLPHFEGEDEEGYTPVHHLMWKLHDEYEVRIIRPAKPKDGGEDEEVDVVGLDGEAGDEKGGAQVYMNGIFTPPQPNTAKFSNSKPVSKLGQPDFQSSEPQPSQPGPEVPREPVPRNPDLQSRQFLPSTSVFCTSTRIVRVRLREEWRGLVGYEGGVRVWEGVRGFAEI